MSTSYTCTKRGNDIRCECGAQLAVGGTLHRVADIAFGFNRKGQFELKTKASRRIGGYQGFCMKCRKSGDFALAE